MNSLKAIILGCILVFMFASCASTVPMATHEQDMLAKSFQAPINDKSIIYLIRPSEIYGSAVNISIVVDKLMIGSLSDGTYTVVQVSPGNHQNC